MVLSWSAIKLLQKRVSCGQDWRQIGGKLPEQLTLRWTCVATVYNLSTNGFVLSTPPFRS
jgi:hypothetical protein